MVRVGSRLTQLLAVLTPVLDIVHGAVDEPEAPAWCVERGWEPFLLALSDAELAEAEANGLASSLSEHPAAPLALRALLRDARACSLLPRVAMPACALPAEALRGVPARKREQLSVLLAVLAPSAERAERIVDVGAGSGHFARLAAELFGRETVALDRDRERLLSGTRRSEDRERSFGTLAVRFQHTDLAHERLELRATDLAVGLHACGDLGDRLVLAARAARCELALVSCCLQKIAAPERRALSQTAGVFSLRKAALGLANLTAQVEGVEASLLENLRAREQRLALRRLLCARGLDVRAGEEMRGVNRRRAQHGLRELASLALSQRGLAAPTPDELTQHGAAARRDHAVMRRLALPRTLLARTVELAVVLDRATLLEEQGLAVNVTELCERRVTPRNTLLSAQG